MTHTEVRRRRMALGLTQGQLGAMVGVTYATVNRWENERVEVPLMLSWAFIGIEKFLIDQAAENEKSRRAASKAFASQRKKGRR